MINCGGSIPLISELQLQSRVHVFLLDSHRPYDLDNVHSEQVHILHDSLDQGSMRYPDPPEDSDSESEDEDIEEVGVDVRELNEDDDDDDEEGDDVEQELFAEENGEPGSKRRSGGSEGEPSAKRRRKMEAQEAKRLRDAARIAAREQRREGTMAQRRQRERLRLQQVKAYYNGSSYGCATSVLMYEICNQLNKASNQDLWLSIIGLTDQFLHERVTTGQYGALHSHISNEALRRGNESPQQMQEALLARNLLTRNTAADAIVTKVGHIGDSMEYRFQLLRHWNLYSAMKHSPYVAARFETWTEAGKDKLKLLLTELGISTQDAKQTFMVMSIDRKTRLEELIDERSSDERYNIPDVRFKSFQRQQTPSLALGAVDTTLALSALLELPHHDAGGREKFSDFQWEQAFWKAWDAMSNESAGAGSAGAGGAGGAGSAASSSASAKLGGGGSKGSGIGPQSSQSLLLRGIDQSIELSQAMLRCAQTLMAGSSGSSLGKFFKHGGDFRYVVLPQSSDSKFLSRPLTLTRLGLFLNEIVSKTKNLPLVVASPVPERGVHLVVCVLGTALTPEVLVRNPFGSRFAEAAAPTLPELEEEDLVLQETEEERRARLAQDIDGSYSRLRVKQEAWDPTIIEVQNEDVEAFLTRLTDQLEE